MEFMIRLWKDPVWSKVIATGIITLIVAISTYIFKLWPDIQSFIKISWSFIVSSTETPNWLLAIMTVPCLLFIIALISEFKTEESEPLNFTDYVQDQFFGLSWHWQYSGQQITNLYSLCPECHYQIFPKSERNYQTGDLFYKYSCEDCGYKIQPISIGPQEFEHKVALKIQKKLRTGKWVQ